MKKPPSGAGSKAGQGDRVVAIPPTRFGPPVASVQMVPAQSRSTAGVPIPPTRYGGAKPVNGVGAPPSPVLLSGPVAKAVQPAMRVVAVASSPLLPPLPVVPNRSDGAGPNNARSPFLPPPGQRGVVQRMEIEGADEDSGNEADDESAFSWGTMKLRGGKQAGWVIEGETKNMREPRSYAAERDRQILRHFSSQLFFLAKSKVSEAQEIQTLSIGSNLFVAANSSNDIAAIYDQIKSNTQLKLQQVLTETWGSDRSAAYFVHSKATKKKSSARFGSKMAALYADVRDFSGGYAAIDPTVIADTIKQGKVIVLNVSDVTAVRAAFSETSSIFLIVGGGEGRHAEEKLMDALEISESSATALISGKKRPCKTCLGRMRHVASQGFTLAHSNLPGFIWKERYDGQPEGVKRFTEGVISEGASYITVRPKNKVAEGYGVKPKSYSEKPDFATDSDSDG